jgi:CBS domain-containing protein
MAGDLLTVEGDVPVEEAVRRMNDRRVGAVLVLEGDRLVGVFTERDVLRAVADGLTPTAVVGDWMTRGPETIEPDDTAEHAAIIMIHGGFRHLPVVEAGKVVGILSIRDLMRSVLDDAAPRGV